MANETARRHRPFLNPRTGRGKELMEMLRHELGVPEDAKTFEVRFAIDEVVSVKVDYMPREVAPRAEG